MDMIAFSVANVNRCSDPDGFNHDLNDWTLSDWCTAVLGELGEAANIIKKMNRIRDGIRNKESKDQLETMLMDEIADTFIYLDLLAQAAGFSLNDAVIAKWNAKSNEIGYPHLIWEENIS